MLGSGDPKLGKLKDKALVNVNGVSTEKKLVVVNREKRMKSCGNRKCLILRL